MRITPSIAARISEDHRDLWDSESVRDEMRLVTALYETRYWEDVGANATEIPIETADANALVESYQAALFSKNPAVLVRHGADRAKTPTDGPGAVQALTSTWLRAHRDRLEEISVRALVWPHCGALLVPMVGEDASESSIPTMIDIDIVPPWDLVLDVDAPSWEQQRWLGYRVRMSRDDVANTYGSTDKWNFRPIPGYLVGPDQEPDPTRQVSGEGDEDMWVHAEVWVLYAEGRKVVWSPDYDTGQSLVSDEVCPYTDARGTNVIPITRLRYKRSLSQPLLGLSLLAQLADSYRETNLARSFLAGAARRMARQYLSRKGVLSEESEERIRMGEDGCVLHVEDNTTPLSEILYPIPNSSIPGEILAYVTTMRGDASQGQVAAPFARGVPTNVTATEAQALNVYTASGYGRMSREKDAFVEELSKLVLPMYALYVDDGRPIVSVSGDMYVLSERILRGDYEIYAEDAGTTPLSRMAKRQDFLTVVPMLVQLGVPKEAILREIQGLYEFSEALRGDIRKLSDGRPVQVVAGQATQPTAEPPTTGIGVGEQPSPQRALDILSAGDIGIAKDMGGR